MGLQVSRVVVICSEGEKAAAGKIVTFFSSTENWSQWIWFLHCRIWHWRDLFLHIRQKHTILPAWWETVWWSTPHTTPLCWTRSLIWGLTAVYCHMEKIDLTGTFTTFDLRSMHLLCCGSSWAVVFGWEHVTLFCNHSFLTLIRMWGILVWAGHSLPDGALDHPSWSYGPAASLLLLSGLWPIWPLHVAAAQKPSLHAILQFPFSHVNSMLSVNLFGVTSLQFLPA